MSRKKIVEETVTTDSFETQFICLNEYCADSSYYYLLDMLKGFNLDKYKDNKDFEFDHKFVNVLFSKVIQTLEKYAKKLHSVHNNFKMIEYSMFKHAFDKFSVVVSPVFKIELLPKIFLNSMFIRIQFKDRVKYYQYAYNDGFIELDEKSYKDKEMTIKNNENEIDFIPMKEMEF